MWVKQCHFYHSWLGMVNIPPIKMVMTWGWFVKLFYPHYWTSNFQEIWVPKSGLISSPRCELYGAALYTFRWLWGKMLIHIPYMERVGVCDLVIFGGWTLVVKQMKVMSSPHTGKIGLREGWADQCQKVVKTCWLNIHGITVISGS